MSGSINIGFEFNRDIKEVVRLKAGSVIGAYNCTMNKKTMFNYRVHRNLKSFIIRKSKWYNLINDEAFNEIASPMKKNITDNYMNYIKEPILNFQLKFLQKKQDQACEDQLSMALVNTKTEIMVIKKKKDSDEGKEEEDVFSENEVLKTEQVAQLFDQKFMRFEYQIRNVIDQC